MELSEFGEKTQRFLAKDSKSIEAEFFHHVKYCEFCIPGALDMDEKQRLCSEGLSYLRRMRKAKRKEKVK